MKKLLTALATVAVAATAAGVLAVPSQAAGSTVTLRPEALPRGAEVAGAHFASLDSRTIVDGDVRVRVRGDYVGLLGKYQNAYVVLAERDGVISTLVLGRGGSERVLARDVEPEWVDLSSDGELLTIVRPGRTRTVAVDAVDVRTGRVTATHTFAGSPRVLDVLDGRAVLGGDRLGTVSWDVASNEATRLSRRHGYRADLAADRLATFDGDPYLGGCTIVTSATRPQTRLWTSCSERVEAFSPDGRRAATVDILSDGPGPSRVKTFSIRGQLLAGYAVDGRFGGMRFESARALVLATYGAEQAAYVRCTGSSCERASALSPTPEL